MDCETQSDRESVQPAFNDFLRFRAEARRKTKRIFKSDYRQAYAAKTLFYMAGYALPFLDDAAKDKIHSFANRLCGLFSRGPGDRSADAYLDDLDNWDAASGALTLSKILTALRPIGILALAALSDRASIVRSLA